MSSVNVHYFLLSLVNGTLADVEAAVSKFAAKPEEPAFQHGGQDYLLDQVSWDPKTKMATGVIYKLRGSSLPRKVNDTAVNDLGLTVDERLGEPMCFALSTKLGAVAVHYSHNGARHGCIGAALHQMSFGHAVRLEPLLRTDVWEKLKGSKAAKKFSFKIARPDGIRKQDATGTVKRAIDIAGDFEGATVEVSVSMGHNKGSLNVKSMKQAALELVGLNTANQPVVSSLAATIQVDDQMEPLDLLRARLEDEVGVVQAKKHLNTADCCTKLVGKIADRRKDIKAQQGQTEDD